MAAHDLTAVNLLETQLAGLDLSEDFTVIRAHRPEFSPKELSFEPLVVVAPGGRAKRPIGKNHTIRAATVFVGILSLLPHGAGFSDSEKSDLTRLEELLNFVEELETWLLPDTGRGVVISGPQGSFQLVGEVNTNPTYDPDKIEQGQFISVIEANFEGIS
ncbi:hypothetical protein KOR42_33100 [Thalassoglobus neptunius]|uniref:Uncharacterized protein n=1 Tax=Thalassoglobus neptunius TaxID=1938619 RepID=A0A5C5WMI9_9PLAN|nr:hypothetical protein [Thalassoglobus neptunius]TWT51837.1 hypothetical protein KOR42_33100 [Thalassoglobus neptunius]